MSYLENLKKFKEAGFKVWEIVCANEVNNLFTITEKTNEKKSELSAEDAETIIKYVYDWIMDYEDSANAVCYAIKYAFSDGELTIDDFNSDEDVCRECLLEYV